MFIHVKDDKYLDVIYLIEFLVLGHARSGSYCVLEFSDIQMEAYLGLNATS